MSSKPSLTTAAEVLAACERARIAVDCVPVVAFDADHTLWNADIGDLGWHAVVNDRLIRRGAGPALRAEVVTAGGSPTGDVHADARQLYDLYKQDRVSELAIVRAMTVCYAGWSVEELRALARRLARDVLAGARYEGVRGVFPLDADRDVLGAEVHIERGVLGAEMREPVTFFEGKVEALKILLPGKRPSFAFGDSKGDVPLLHHAARAAFAVNPRPQLRKLATERDGFYVFDPPRTVGGAVVRAPGTDRVIE